MRLRKFSEIITSEMELQRKYVQINWRGDDIRDFAE